MDFNTSGSTLSTQGLQVTAPVVVATESIDTLDKTYSFFVDFYKDQEKSFDSFNIAKVNKGVVEVFNNRVSLGFDEVMGKEGEEVDITIYNALMAKLEKELKKFGLTLISNGK